MVRVKNSTREKKLENNVLVYFTTMNRAKYSK
jgi:hypothetical protein